MLGLGVRRADQRYIVVTWTGNCLAAAAIEFIKIHYANCSTLSIILMSVERYAFIKRINEYENRKYRR